MKTTYDPINEAQLLLHIQGKASAEWNKKIENWRAANPSHEQDYQTLIKVWQTAPAIFEADTNVDTAWDNFQSRLNNKPSRAKLFYTLPWLRVAAVLVLFITVGLWWWQIKPITISSNDQVLTHHLPDGSRVTLNVNSSISYSKKFNAEKRQIAMDGEAFFDVKRDEQMPFIIQANGSEIKVLGTSFNVATHREQTEVIVESGLVEFITPARDQILKAGEMATYDAGNQLLQQRSTPDSLHQAYRTNLLIYDGTPLWRVVAILNRNFQADIRIENEMVRQYPLTATFQNDSLPNILNVIALTFNLRIVYNKDSILIQQ